jgi:replicative DNA helicase
MPGVILPPTPEAEEGRIPPFPVDALPPILRNITRAISEVCGMPHDLSGPMVLATASACLGRGLMAEVAPGKPTPPNLYTLVVKPSGAGGSTAYNHATAPLRGFQAEEMKTYDEETRPRLEARRDTLASDIQRKVKERSDAIKDGDEARALQLMKEIQELKVEVDAVERQSIRPYYLIRDVTEPRLAGIMHGRGEVMAHFDPDGSNSIAGLLGTRNGSGDHANDNLWLSAFTTTESVTISRQGSGKGNSTDVHLEFPCLACLFVVTPDIAKKLTGSERAREGGLLPRFLISVSHARPQPWSKGEMKIPSEVAEDYRRGAFAMLNNYRNKGLGDLSPIPAEEAAEAIFFEHQRGFCESYKEDTATFDARHTENAIRVALVLHAWECVTLSEPAEVYAHERPLSEQTARNALRLMEWFTLHQTALLAPHREAARAGKLDKIKALCPRKDYEISARDLVAARVASDAKEATQLLEQWVTEKECVKEEVEPTGKGGKPRSPRYRFPRGRV